MERKRDGLGSIGEVFSGPSRLLKKALRSASPQPHHYFTQADQVNQLVGASEADPDMGFMARLMALCSLPRTNPGNRLQFKRVNGPYKLIMTATGEYTLPFGNIPRLLLAWVCTEAVRTQSRELVLGRSLAEFMRTLGIYHNSGGRGGVQTRLRNQMKRLFRCSISLNYEDEHGDASVSSFIAPPHRVLVERAQTRPASVVGEQDRTQRGLLQRDHQPPRPARYEHPAGAQTILAWTRSLPVANLPGLLAHSSFPARLDNALPAVRSGPEQGWGQVHCAQFSHRLPPGVEEDQERLARAELRHGQGGADPVPPRRPRSCRHISVSWSSSQNARYPAQADACWRGSPSAASKG